MLGKSLAGPCQVATGPLETLGPLVTADFSSHQPVQVPLGGLLLLGLSTNSCSKVEEVYESIKSTCRWIPQQNHPWIDWWGNLNHAVAAFESLYISRQKKMISKKVPQCKALKKLGYLWSSFGQGLTIKELCIQLPTTISQYSSICYASTYPRILSHLLFRRNFLQSTRERQTHNSNPRCKNDVFHTKKTHSQPDFAAVALSSCHPVADQRRRPSCRVGPISQATKYSESHTFHSLFTDSETFCRSSALWDFCAASREKQHYVITNELQSIHIIYYTHMYIYNWLL